MPINKARNHYLGKEGLKRLNCAQSVISAFKEKYEIDDDTIDLFKGYGGGNAPEGVCGAFYAGMFALEKQAPEKIEEFKKYFIENAGSLSCREIRTNKKLSCVGCVEKSSEYLHSST